MQDNKIIRILLEEDILLNVLNAIDDNLSVMDEELNVLWVNRNYHERLGKKYSDVIGKKCYVLWHHRMTPCQDCPCVKALQSGQIEVFERETPEGRYFYLVGIPIYHDGKKLVFEIGREITERKLARDKYLQHLRLHTINYFINDLCHHLNNIFNGLKGITNLLKKEISLTESKDRIIKLSELIERGIDFINSLDKLRVRNHDKSIFNLNYLLLSMKNLLSQLIEDSKKNIAIEYSLSEDNLMIKANILQVHDAVVELFKNAIDVIENTGKIVIKTGRESSKIFFSIEDTGLGMTEREVQLCFNPFFSSDPKKYGLGLTYVKNIVDIHDGSIEIESHPGKGTKVKISFTEAT